MSNKGRGLKTRLKINDNDNDDNLVKSVLDGNLNETIQKC